MSSPILDNPPESFLGLSPRGRQVLAAVLVLLALCGTVFGGLFIRAAAQVRKAREDIDQLGVETRAHLVEAQGGPPLERDSERARTLSEHNAKLAVLTANRNVAEDRVEGYAQTARAVGMVLLVLAVGVAPLVVLSASLAAFRQRGWTPGLVLAMTPAALVLAFGAVLWFVTQRPSR